MRREVRRPQEQWRRARSLDGRDRVVGHDIGLVVRRVVGSRVEGALRMRGRLEQRIAQEWWVRPAALEDKHATCFVTAFQELYEAELEGLREARLVEERQEEEARERFQAWQHARDEENARRDADRLLEAEAEAADVVVELRPVEAALRAAPARVKDPDLRVWPAHADALGRLQADRHQAWAKDVQACQEANEERARKEPRQREEEESERKREVDRAARRLRKAQPARIQQRD